jgi:hypothetical protein
MLACQLERLLPISKLLGRLRLVSGAAVPSCYTWESPNSLWFD